MPDPFDCMACRGTRAIARRSRVPDYFLPTGIRADYVECADCGLVQQFPLPAEVGPFYAGYPVHAHKSVLHELARRAVLRPVYFPCETLRPDQVLLDYGCGDGWFLDRAKSRVAAAYGFEPAPALAGEVARRVGVPVFHDTRALSAALAGRVDVITLHFVMEHLTDLRGVLAMLSALLKPGGVIRAIVPNLDNLEYRWFGARWHGFDAPRHISFPAPGHLGPVLSACGLSLRGDCFVPFPNTLAASLCIALTGRYRPPVFMAFLPLAIPWSRLYPRGTRAMTLARE